MAYSSLIIPAKCNICGAPAKVKVHSWRNELWGEYCHAHGKQILAMLLKREKEDSLATKAKLDTEAAKGE